MAMGAVKQEVDPATELARYCYPSNAKKQERAMATGPEEDGGELEPELEVGDLIPGLPDDVAMECLARVPSRSHRRMRRVCRGWRGAVASPEFRRRRKVAGATEDIVFLVQASPAGGNGKGSSTPECALTAANLTTGEWRRVNAEASWGPVPLFAQCAAAGGRHIAVVGGWDPATLRPTTDVRVLDVHAGTWRRGRPMPDTRSFFGCAGGGGGDVYVAGGHDESKNALRSALAYAVAADAWRALPDMAEERDEPQLVATTGGGVLAASGYTTEAQGAFKRTAERYDATGGGGGGGGWAHEGEVVLPDAGETTCLASVRGKVWAVRAGKAGVREWDGGAWRDVGDGPPGVEACVKAVGVGDGDGAALFVFGTAASAAGGSRYSAWVMEATGGPWKPVPVPSGFGCFVYSAAAVRV